MSGDEAGVGIVEEAIVETTCKRGRKPEVEDEKDCAQSGEEGGDGLDLIAFRRSKQEEERDDIRKFRGSGRKCSASSCRRSLRDMAEARGKRLENDREKIVHRVDSRSWLEDLSQTNSGGARTP